MKSKKRMIRVSLCVLSAFVMQSLGGRTASALEGTQNQDADHLAYGSYNQVVEEDHDVSVDYNAVVPTVPTGQALQDDGGTINMHNKFSKIAEDIPLDYNEVVKTVPVEQEEGEKNEEINPATSSAISDRNLTQDESHEGVPGEKEGGRPSDEPDAAGEPVPADVPASAEDQNPAAEPGATELPEAVNEPDRMTEPLSEDGEAADALDGQKMDPVLSVIFPSMLDFTIDPLDIMGKGQIFSDQFLFENNSNVDVRITLTNMNYYFSNDQDFRPLSEPYSEENEVGLKDIYLCLKSADDWADETDMPREWVITDPDKPEEISFVLSRNKEDDNNKALFYLDGSVAENPKILWNKKDVKLEMTVKIEVAEDLRMEPLSTEPSAAPGDYGDTGEETPDEAVPNPGQTVEPADNEKITNEVLTPQAVLFGVPAAEEAWDSKIKASLEDSDDENELAPNKIPIQEGGLASEQRRREEDIPLLEYIPKTKDQAWFLAKSRL